MFKNIGKKIKLLTLIGCGVGIGLSFVMGIALIITSLQSGNETPAIIGSILLLLGPLSFWINSFIAYGYGQLIENSDILVKLNKNLFK